MQCDFLDYVGGILSGGYYCKKDDKYVDTYTRNTYCDNSLKYRQCPIYIKGNSSGGCYLTTAVCDILGKEDDCPTLEALRSFRDNYMKKHEECIPLLEDYDVVGPIISEKLAKDDNRVKIANAMLNIFINEALDAIKDKEYNAAIDTYENMTIYLMDYFNLDMSLLNSRKAKAIVRKREINK